MPILIPPVLDGSGGFVLSPSTRQTTPTVPTAPFTIQLVDSNGNPATAPTGGQSFLLSDGSSGGTFAPTSVTVPAGQTNATFTYAHGSVGIYTISAAPSGGVLAGQSPQTASVSVSATGTGGTPSGGGRTMPAVKNKANRYFNYGYLSAIDQSGNEIVFGTLKEFTFKSNLGLVELSDPDSLLAVAVGISEQKITISAKAAQFKTEQLLLAMGGTRTALAAITDPATAPTLTAGTGPSTMTAGYVAVAYAWRTPYGATKISPLQTVQITNTQKITVSSLTLPTGATFVDLYVSAQSYASAPLAAAAPVYKLGQIAGGAAYDILAYAAATANLPNAKSQVGIARDVYAKGQADEPLTCRLQFFSEKDGSGVEMVAYGVIVPSYEFSAGERSFIIPGFEAMVFGDDTLGKVFEMLVPTGG